MSIADACVATGAARRHGVGARSRGFAGSFADGIRAFARLPSHVGALRHRSVDGVDTNGVGQDPMSGLGMG